MSENILNYRNNLQKPDLDSILTRKAHEYGYVKEKKNEKKLIL